MCEGLSSKFSISTKTPAYSSWTGTPELILTNHIYRILVSNGHSVRYWGLELQHTDLEGPTIEPTTVPPLISNMPLRNLISTFSQGGNWGSGREHLQLERASVDGETGIQNWLQIPVFYYICKICLFTASAWFLLGSACICQLMESGPFHHQILTELHFKTFTERLLLGGQFESKMTQNMDQLLIYLKCDGKTDIKQAIILQEVQQFCCSGIHTNVGTSYSASNFCNFTWMAKDYKKHI